MYACTEKMYACTKWMMLITYVSNTDTDDGYGRNVCVQLQNNDDDLPADTVEVLVEEEKWK